MNRKLQKIVSSNAFCLTTCDVLGQLAAPVISNPKIFKKIDFNYLELISIELITRKTSTFFESDNAQHSPPESNPKDTPQPTEAFLFRPPSFGTSTQLFFLYLESLSTMFAPLVDHVEHLNNRLQRIQQKLKSTPPSSPDYNMLKQHMINTKTAFISIKIAIENPSRMGLINRFYESLLIYLMQTFQHKGNMRVPQHFLKTYVRINRFLADIDKTFIDRFSARFLSTYIDFLLLVLSEPFSKSALHMRASLMDVLFSFYYINPAKTNAKLSTKLVSLQDKARFLNSILQFYVQVNFLTDFESINSSKIRYRLFMSKFLNESLLATTFQEAFKLNQKTPEMSDFIGHLLSDLNSHLEESFINFEKIKELKNEIARNPPRSMLQSNILLSTKT